MIQSNWEKPSLYWQRLVRWLDERREKHFNADYKRNSILLNYVKINLDRPVELEECFMRDVTQLDFWDPWSSHMSGGKKRQSLWAEEQHPYHQTWRCTSLVIWWSRSRVACSVFRFKSHLKKIRSNLKKQCGNVITKDYQWSGNFLLGL